MQLRFSLTLAAACAAAPAFAADPASTAVLKQALTAQGGEQLLRSLKSVQFEASGYRNMLEQSVRPEGPYIVEFHELKELHDYPQQALRRELQVRMPPDTSYTMTTVAAGRQAMTLRAGSPIPGSGWDLKQAAESLALSPERVLLTALDAPSAHLEAATVLHGVPHQVVAFSLDGAPARLYLDGNTHLPCAVDYAGPMARSGYAGYLGEATQRTTWSFWRLENGGLRYPMQWDIQINGLPDRVMMLHALTIDAAYDPALIAVPAELAARFSPSEAPRDMARLLPGAKKTEILPGVLQVETAWNTALVDQGDGIVVIEAPLSPGYSAALLEEAARRYPGKAIKAVVTTSDSWPHLAGLKEYAARGIPIYALDLSEPIVRRTTQGAARPPELRLVGGKTVIGTGPNRLELYPLRGASTERQMMVYFPAHKMLYGSDPFQPTATGYTDAEAVLELVQAVARERLEVENFFMMHAPPAPYRKLLDFPALKAAQR